MVDIVKSYRLLLSRDWSYKRQGYFTTKRSHLSLTYKGRNNEIKVNNEPFMKHTITSLEGSNKPIIYAQEEMRFVSSRHY